MEPLKHAAKGEAEKLGHLVKEIANYMEPMTKGTIGCASKTMNSKHQMAMLDQAKSVSESALQMLIAAKEGGGNPRVSVFFVSLTTQLHHSWVNKWFTIATNKFIDKQLLNCVFRIVKREANNYYICMCDICVIVGPRLYCHAKTNLEYTAMQRQTVPQGNIQPQISSWFYQGRLKIVITFILTLFHVVIHVYCSYEPTLVAFICKTID